MGVTRRPTLWTHAGAAALIAGLAACGDATEAPAPADTTEAAEPAPVDTAAISGEGGPNESEGGEGGVTPEAARQDPVAFLSAMEVMRAHYLAGIDALTEGEREAGGEMFAHPISEIYVPLESVLGEMGVTPFFDEMTAASQAPFTGASDAEIRAHVDTVLAAIDAAEEHAPQSAAGLTDAQIQAQVAADMCQRAALQYRFAKADPDAGEAYLDGYGLARTCALLSERHGAAIAAESQATADALAAASAALAAAYPTAVKPATLAADDSALLAATADARAAARDFAG